MENYFAGHGLPTTGLNDALSNGSVIEDELLYKLSRFRTYRHVFFADISISHICRFDILHKRLIALGTIIFYL